MVAHLQQPGEVEETTEEVRFEDLAALVSERADDRAERRALRRGAGAAPAAAVRAVPAGHPGRGRAGVRARPAEPGQPQRGRRRPVRHRRVAGADRARARATCTTALERCPRAALVVTKTDLHQHWRQIVETNRAPPAPRPGWTSRCCRCPRSCGCGPAGSPRSTTRAGSRRSSEFLAGVLEQTLSRQAGDRRPRGRLRRGAAGARDRRRARRPGHAPRSARRWSNGSTRCTSGPGR